jgi:hypothetical protein
MPTTKFIAIGHYEDKTVQLTPTVELVNGVFDFDGSDEDFALLAPMLALQYNVHCEEDYDEARAAFEELKANDAINVPVETPESEERKLRDDRMARRFIAEKLSPTAVYGEGIEATRVQGVMAKILEAEEQTKADAEADVSAEAALKDKQDADAKAKADAEADASAEAALKEKQDADAKAKADASAEAALKEKQDADAKAAATVAAPAPAPAPAPAAAATKPVSK